jgi:hypothetical protein
MAKKKYDIDQIREVAEQLCGDMDCGCEKGDGNGNPCHEAFPEEFSKWCLGCCAVHLNYLLEK